MRKEDFFRELQECLEGEISLQEINDSMTYYRGYIRDEMASGKSEEEVLSSLGSPRLIARSIIDASAEGERNKSSYYDSEEVVYRSDEENEQVYRESGKKDTFQMIIRRVVIFLIVVLVLFAVGTLITSLLPVILVFLVIYLVLRFIHR